MEKWSV